METRHNVVQNAKHAGLFSARSSIVKVSCTAWDSVFYNSRPQSPSLFSTMQMEAQS